MKTNFQDQKDQFTGALLTPGDEGYDQARRGWNLVVDQYPAAILMAKNTQDIIAGIRLASEAGLKIAVQSTGHGAKYPADGQFMIHTSQLNEIVINAEAQTARVGAGVYWKQVLDQTCALGLAPLLGSSPMVGVVGYTLGGGLGWLVRKYGMAADSVLAIEVVTPDGVLRRATTQENADLFWAILGGAGNFGVITTLEFQLYPVTSLYGGFLVYPAEQAREAMRFYRAWVRTLPDEMTSSFSVMKFPSLPIMPEPVRGKTLVFIRAAWSGAPEDGQAFIQPWLYWQTPLENAFRVMPFAAVGEISNDPVDPMPTYHTNELVNELSDEFIEIFTRQATAAQSPLFANEIRHVGGAVARTSAERSAISHRSAEFYLTLLSGVFSPEMAAAIELYVKAYKAELRPHLHGGIYLNFMDGKEALERVQDAYSAENFQRLSALKNQYDPQNLFCFSSPLQPAFAAA
jgi:FAD/FMN-containing dehydrogenase